MDSFVWLPECVYFEICVRVILATRVSNRDNGSLECYLLLHVYQVTVFYHVAMSHPMRTFTYDTIYLPEPVE